MKRRRGPRTGQPKFFGVLFVSHCGVPKYFGGSFRAGSGVPKFFGGSFRCGSGVPKFFGGLFRAGSGQPKYFGGVFRRGSGRPKYFGCPQSGRDFRFETQFLTEGWLAQRRKDAKLRLFCAAGRGSFQAPLLCRNDAPDCREMVGRVAPRAPPWAENRTARAERRALPGLLPVLFLSFLQGKTPYA